MSIIFHILNQKDWQAAQATGEYRPASLINEGFIHFSTNQQAVAVANTFYKGQADLLLLKVDVEKLTAPLKWEPPVGLPAPSGHTAQELFPHLYGVLNLSAVIDVIKFPLNANGIFELPEKLK